LCHICCRRQAAEPKPAEPPLEEEESNQGLLQQETERCLGNEQCEKFSGRRIVNIGDLFEQIKDLDNHGPFGCTFSNMQIMSEKRVGLKSGFVVKCSMCNYKTTIWSEKNNKNVMDVNTGAVCGTITTGGGHTQLAEFLSVLDIPSMSQPTFKNYEEKVSAGWAATAAAEMEAAAAEEARLARQLGEVDADGTPLITVVADGAWCKRSYRTNYSALSGVVSASIIII
jgi:hypothetical protein